MKGAFDFSLALQVLKAGARVGRLSWGGGHWIQITLLKIDTSYAHFILVKQSHDGLPVEWTPNMDDMLAEDWTAEHREDLPK
jgi:hypothetical protein